MALEVPLCRPRRDCATQGRGDLKNTNESEEIAQILGDSTTDEDMEDDDDITFVGESDTSSLAYRSRSRKDIVQMKLMEYFNTASPDEIRKLSRSQVGVIKRIVALRPFSNPTAFYKEFGDTAMVSTLARMYNAEIDLDSLLFRCWQISDSMARAVESLNDLTAETLLEQPSSIPSSLSLKSYQLVGVTWLSLMLQNGFNGILADEMGLGKTIQVIAFLCYLKEHDLAEDVHLIIVPASCVNNWLDEFHRWAPGLSIEAYYGTVDERESFRADWGNGSYDELDVIVTTYNMVTSQKADRSFFKKSVSADYAIFDEAHMLKNCTSMRYQALMKTKAARRLLLTGTPLQNNLVELMSLLNFVMPKLFADHYDNLVDMLKIFSNKNDASADYQQAKIEQAKSIMKPFVLRRVKTDVLYELPSKAETIKRCPMLENQKRLYDKVFNQCIDTLSPGDTDKSFKAKTGLSLLMELRKAANHPLLLRNHYTDQKLTELVPLLIKEPEHYDANPDYIFEDMQVMTDFEIHQMLLKYKRIRSYCLPDDAICNSGKVAVLEDLLQSIRAERNKVLLFSQFTMVLDIIEAYCKFRQLSYLRMDGQTPVVDRQDLIDKFNTDDNVFIFLLSTKAGGLGINLTSANYIIIHDIDYNPYNDKQAEDRCHRVGQTKEVNVIKLISEASVEETMLKYAAKKLSLQQQMTETGEGEEDVESMLRQIFQKTYEDK